MISGVVPRVAPGVITVVARRFVSGWQMLTKTIQKHHSMLARVFFRCIAIEGADFTLIFLHSSVSQQGNRVLLITALTDFIKLSAQLIDSICSLEALTVLFLQCVLNNVSAGLVVFAVPCNVTSFRSSF